MTHEMVQCEPESWSFMKQKQEFTCLRVQDK